MDARKGTIHKLRLHCGGGGGWPKPDQKMGCYVDLVLTMGGRVQNVLTIFAHAPQEGWNLRGGKIRRKECHRLRRKGGSKRNGNAVSSNLSPPSNIKLSSSVHFISPEIARQCKILLRARSPAAATAATAFNIPPNLCRRNP